MKLKLILAVIVTVMPGVGYASSSTGGNISWTDDPCIHNCMNCAQWESATCCTICRAPRVAAVTAVEPGYMTVIVITVNKKSAIWRILFEIWIFTLQDFYC